MGAGFFGKLPGAGDFLARKLPPDTRAPLDRWLTRLLAPHAARPGLWPPEGFRGAVRFGGGALALLILPSADAAGRCFPLAVIAPADGAGQGGIDLWADAALDSVDRAVAGEVTVAELVGALAGLEGPGQGGRPLEMPCLWSGKTEPMSPEAAILRRFPAPSSG